MGDVVGDELCEEGVDVGAGMVVCVCWHDDSNGGVGVEQGLVMIGYVASPDVMDLELRTFGAW